MSQNRPSRFLGIAAAPRGGCRPIAEDPALPFRDLASDFLLHSERPVLRAGPLSVNVLGAITAADEGGPLEEPERLVAGLYTRHGRKLAQRIDGWFLVIVYDHERRELVVINNPYASGNCYYCRDGSELIFADSVSRVLERLGSRPGLDKGSLINYLNNGYNHTEHTCFEGVGKLLPGCLLRFHGGNVSLEKHYEMRFARRPRIDLQASLEEYERLFREDMRRFLAANRVRELGAAISGGLDTSWTFHAAAAVHDRPVHGYTDYFRQEQYNELGPAGRVVEAKGGIHHKVPCGPEDFDLFPRLVAIAEEPVLSVSLPLYRLVQEAHGTVDALVYGEGGNNIYSIYYPVAEVHRYLRGKPWLLRRALDSGLRALGTVSGQELFWQAAHVAKIFAAEADYRPRFFERLTSHFHFDRELRAELLDPAFSADAQMHRSWCETAPRDDFFFDDLIDLNISHGLKPYLLFFEHRMAAAHDMGLCAPFLSKKVVAFVNSLPQEWVVGGGSLARLLRHKSSDRPFHKLALERIYPKDHVHREPRLFYAPYHAMFRERPAVADKLRRALKRRGWYNERFLDRLFAEHRQQSLHARLNSQMRNHGQRLMALLGCEVWARLYLDGKTASGEGMVIEDFLG
jgi:asparagine synthase (glutamine-hydrolysing)